MSNHPQIVFPRPIIPRLFPTSNHPQIVSHVQFPLLHTTLPGLQPNTKACPLQNKCPLLRVVTLCTCVHFDPGARGCQKGSIDSSNPLWLGGACTPLHWHSLFRVAWDHSPLCVWFWNSLMLSPTYTWQDVSSYPAKCAKWGHLHKCCWRRPHNRKGSGTYTSTRGDDIPASFSQSSVLKIWHAFTGCAWWLNYRCSSPDLLIPRIHAQQG